MAQHKMSLIKLQLGDHTLQRTSNKGFQLGELKKPSRKRKRLKKGQRLDNQKCFLCFLGERKTILKKFLFQCITTYMTVFMLKEVHQDPRAVMPHVQSNQLWFSDFNVHQNLLEGLLTQIAESSSQKYLLSKYKVGLKNLHF